MSGTRGKQKKGEFKLGRGQTIAYDKPVPKFLQAFLAPPALKSTQQQCSNVDDDLQPDREEEDEIPEEIKQQLEAAKIEMEKTKKEEIEKKLREEEERLIKEEEKEGIHRFRVATKRKLNSNITTIATVTTTVQKQHHDKTNEPDTKRAKNVEKQHLEKTKEQKQIPKVNVKHNQNRSMLSFGDTSDEEL